MKIFVSVPKGSEVMDTFFAEEVKQYLEERFEVSYSPLERQLTKEEIAFYAKDAEIIMTGWGHMRMDAETLKDTSVRLIAHTGGTVAAYVDRSVYDAGVRVISGNNLYAESVAEGVLAYMLTALRKIPDYVNCCRNGGWNVDALPTEGLLGQTVGIVGMGAISKRVMKLLQPFGVRLKVFSHHPIALEFLSENHAVQATLEEIFSTCKIISLHSAKNEKTIGMIGREHFDLMQEGAVFINTARGALVREEEMIRCLKEKRFRAMLDVYCEDPLAVDSELRKMDNVYCMPHVAGPTRDRRPVITKKLADDMVRFEKGEGLELEISAEYAARMTID